jgi:hypothetical protein
MIKTFFAVFGAAFAIFIAGLGLAPTLLLGAYQDDFVTAWTEAGVDTSSCEGSVPKLGIGVRECYEGSMRDFARKIGDASEDRGEDTNGFE